MPSSTPYWPPRRHRHRDAARRRRAPSRGRGRSPRWRRDAARRGAARLDDRRAALADVGQVLVLVPGHVVDGLDGRLAVDGGVEQVGEHRRGVVAPDDEVLDVGERDAELGRQLRVGAVLVQARHRGEALGRDVRRVGLRDQGVGVGRVADDQDLDVVRRVGVDGLALRLEDRAVGLEQVGALHALGARARADQQADVGAVERLVGIGGDVDRPPAAGTRSRRAPSPCLQRPSARARSPAA